jgi:hypothetical protein
LEEMHRVERKKKHPPSLREMAPEGRLSRE